MDDKAIMKRIIGTNIKNPLPDFWSGQRITGVGKKTSHNILVLVCGVWRLSPCVRVDCSG